MTKYAAVILLLLATPVGAAPNVSFFGRTLTPFLYVTSSESGDFGEHWNKRQIYIFRDGTVLVAGAGESYRSELATGAWVISGTASRSRMMELTAALADARVGYQGDCSIDPPDAPLEWYFEFRWFGAGTRTNRFKATQDSGTPCPLAVEGLIDAVHLVINSASQAATTSLYTPLGLVTK
jgi:hypothetical protein